MPQNTTTTLPLQTGVDQPARRHASRSMILQPEDVVALTAEEAATDIEDAIRAFTTENDNGKEPGQRPPQARG